MDCSVLLIGDHGQLGQEIQETFQEQGVDFIGVNREQLDLTQPDLIRNQIQHLQPKIIINCAAYTAVDQAENEPESAYKINAIAPQIIAEEADKLGAFLVHISTDYVFDGQKSSPYLATDLTNPLGIYGKSKRAGEEAIIAHCRYYFILRTAWVYGIYGKGNFVKTMLRLGRERSELRVVSDQIGSPTWTQDLATTISQIIPKLAPELSGIYHFTNSGVASWYDFAVAIFEEAKQLDFPLQIQRVIPITTSEYPTPAQRPAYSVLSSRQIATLMGTFPAHWRQSLRQMLTRLKTKSLNNELHSG